MWSDAARAASAAARQATGSKDLGTVDSGGKWNMSQAPNGRVTATHESGKQLSGSLGEVHEGMGQYGMNHAMVRAGAAPDPANAHAAAALAGGHPKSGLVGIHSASAISRGITKMRLAFHSSDG